jgi:hypothetical protein
MQALVWLWSGLEQSGLALHMRISDDFINSSTKFVEETLSCIGVNVVFADIMVMCAVCSVKQDIIFIDFQK